MEISSVLAFRDVGLLAVMIKYFSHRHRLQRLDLGEYGTLSNLHEKQQRDIYIYIYTNILCNYF